MEVRFYQHEDEPQWDHFCLNGLAGSFLYTRKFLGYHGSRFSDKSLVLHNDDVWLGVMPAALSPSDPSCVISHPGATFGGILHSGHLKGAFAVNAVQTVLNFYRTEGYSTLIYKGAPHIYHMAPYQDDLYALKQAGALSIRCDLSSCIDLQRRPALSNRRQRGVRKAVKAGLSIAGGDRYLPAFWAILQQNLNEKHGVSPVHSLEEISYLAESFPDDIELEVALIGEQIVAGVLYFNGAIVKHAQYIASTTDGHACGALDFLFAHSIQTAAEIDRYRFFDFGISTTDAGKTLNAGLNGFKSEFGASGVIYEHFEISLRSH